MKKIFLFVLITGFIACNDDKDISEVYSGNDYQLFEQLSSESSGIEFTNQVTENEMFNYLLYDGIFQGGGVGLADFDNDGLVDIFFAGNQVNSAIYRNKGNLEFEDKTSTSGIDISTYWSSSVSIADVNNDGLNDIYVCNYLLYEAEERKNKLFLNKGNFQFEEVGEKWNVADTGYSTCATFADIDNDGDVDLYVGNQMPSSTYLRKRQKGIDYTYTDNLYINEGNSFRKVTEASGIKNYAPALSVTASDLNDDGFVDLYVANDYEEPDYMYLNRGDGTFINSANVSLKHMSNFSMGVDIADINNDGHLDIFCADMVAADNFRNKTNMSGMNPKKFWNLVDAGYHHQYMFNVLQLNNGNGTFSDIAQMAGVSNTDWSWATLFSDMDLDGYKDLIVLNGLFRDIRNKDYSNKNKKLIEKYNNLSDYSESEKAKKILELAKNAPSVRLKNKAFKNNGDLTFSDYSEDWNLDFNGWSQGAAYADLDNDGDLDLVINNLNDPSFVYKNNAVEKSINNWLHVKIKSNNPIGTKIYIETEDNDQIIELTSNRGYFSSSEPVAVFGIGQQDKINKLIIRFNDGMVLERNNIKANQILIIDRNSENLSKYEKSKYNSPLFTSTTSQKFFPISHTENEYDDYKREILIPHKMSTLGPIMAKGDVNGDGIEDIFFGGSKGMAGAVFQLGKNGNFQPPIAGSEFVLDKNSEDLGACFFDVDGDGHQDLYVVSGSNEYDEGHKSYADRLYINNGNGVFKKDKTFKSENTSGSIVTASDYDNDGDLDIFVGGRQVPGHYGYNASSTLYENKNGKLVESEMSKNLFKDIGMVSDAVWTDYDGDQDDDLIIVGEWMPITIFNNNNGKLEKASVSGLDNSSGWWNDINVADIDGDGDHDYIIGNLGLNMKFKASANEPFKLYTKDFDGNGTHDVYLAYYDQDGKLYPVRGRQCSSEQMPFIKEKFEDYESFAVAGIEEVLDEKMEGAELKAVQIFESVWIENLGNGSFKIHKLPNEAQIAPVFASIAEDFDGDGDIDVFIVGNYHNREVETTRSDAGTGRVLINDGKGNFTPMSILDSGIYASLDARDATSIKNPKTNKTVIIVANNNAHCQTYELNK